MDRDIALKLKDALNSIKSSMETLVANTTPTSSANMTRNLSDSAIQEETNETEIIPEEPVTRNKK